MPNTPRKQFQLDVYKLLELAQRDRLAQRLTISDRQFVRAQMYLATKPRRDERSEWKHVVGKFLLVVAVFSTFTYRIIRFLSSFK